MPNTGAVNAVASVTGQPTLPDTGTTTTVLAAIAAALVAAGVALGKVAQRR